MRQRIVGICILVAAASSGAGFGQCLAPSAPQIVARPASEVAAGQTYGISWTDTTAGSGSFIVERSASPQFTSPEVQRTGTTGASFISFEPAVWHHRVRAVAACDPARVSPNSATVIATVVSGPPMVVFTTGPVTAIAATGSALSTLQRDLIVENVTAVPVTVRVVSETRDSSPFFQISDAAGGDINALRLEPRALRRLLVRFTAPAESRGVFRGLVALRGVDRELASTPYTWIALTVGASGAAVTPEFRVSGARVDRVVFPGLPANQSDANRPTLRVEVFNPGPEPLDVVEEVGPEAWLTTNARWNASSIPPQSAAPVELRTDRARAFAGAAFPRYTYFAVRTASGRVARLLVQDEIGSTVANRGVEPLPTGRRALLVPLVVGVRGAAGTRFATRAQLTNISDEPLQVEALFRPLGSPANGRRIEMLIDPRDVVSTSDILREKFQLENVGVVEFRLAEERMRFLTVTAESYQVGSPFQQGEITARLPIFEDDEGATASVPHVVPASFNAEARRNIDLMNMPQRGQITNVTVEIVAHDANGSVVQTKRLLLLAGEFVQLNVANFFGLPPNEESRVASILVRVIGEGRVGVMTFAVDNLTGEIRSVDVGQPFGSSPTAPQAADEAAGVSAQKAHMVLGVVNSPASGPAGFGYSSRITVRALGAAAEILLSFLGPSYRGVRARVPIAAGRTLTLPSIEQIFGIPANTPFEGTVTIHSAQLVQVSGHVLAAKEGQTPFITGELPVLSDTSEALTTLLGSRRPVYFDGLEQSTEPTTGRRWTLGLTELSGNITSVNVRLYEPGNRTAPIAEREIDLGPWQHRILDSVFRELGLDTVDRRKDRLNVQVVVTPVGGDGVVVATATGYDDRTGDSTRYVLTPSGGVPATGASKVTPANVPPAEPIARRRAAGR